MKYSGVLPGKFVLRENRFIAIVNVGGENVRCHVRNTGRCGELFVEGAQAFVQKNDSPERKTAYTLLSVYKGNTLFNVDSIAPNKVFYEWVKKGNFFEKDCFIHPEQSYGNSRFDFRINENGRDSYAEIKGVTLEENGAALFPDAPTERGLKHINGLIDAKKAGIGANIFFVLQFDGAEYFTPNIKRHEEFARALKAARRAGVGIFALYCSAEADSLEIAGETKVVLP